MVAAIVVVAAAASAASYASQSSGNDAAMQTQQDQFGYQKQVLSDATKQGRQDLQPYAATGKAANDQLALEMGLGGSGASQQGTGQFGALNQPYTLDQYKTDPGYTPTVNSLQDLQNTPGYNFQLQQGLQSVNNSAAAKGTLLSGQQVKAVNDYAQGQASTGYQSAWDRAQQAYQAAFARNQSQKNNTFSQLQSMANNGQQAATTQGNYSMQGASALAGASSNYANNYGSLQLHEGQLQGQLAQNIGSSVSSGTQGYSMAGGGGGTSGSIVTSSGGTGGLYGSNATGAMSNSITPQFQSGAIG